MTRGELADLGTDPELYLADVDPSVRRIAVAATANHPELHARLIELLSSDPEPAVRRECAEILGRSGLHPVADLERACSDAAPEVREAAVNALGEIASTGSVDLLIATATDQDEDKLVRESAVAALGAIGDPRSLSTLLELISIGPPQIRRRCVPALTVFDGPEVDAALRAAASDRNPMVRETAEMVVGRGGSRVPRPDGE